MDSAVATLDPDPSSLVASQYDEPDYSDRFAVTVRPGCFSTVDEVATGWFVNQAAWIRMISTNTFSRSRIESAIADGGYRVGTSVGSWQVIDRNDDEIVFGDNMGFMEYRFSFRLIRGTPETVEGATVVKYLWPRVAPFYFFFVRHLHRRFIRLLLVRTVGAPEPGADLPRGPLSAF